MPTRFVPKANGASGSPIPTLGEAARYFLRLVHIARPHWPALLRSLGMGLILALLGLVSPYLGKLYFDDVYPGRDVELMHVLVLAVATFSIATALMAALRAYYSQVVLGVLGAETNLMYFNHLQHLPLRFFEERRVGEVLSRLGDLRTALASVTNVFQAVLVNGAYLVVVPPFLLLLSWKLTLVALAMTPITAVVSVLSSRTVRGYLKQSAEHYAELSATQVEALTQIRTVKALAVEQAIFEEARRNSIAQLDAQLKGAAFSSAFGIVNGAVNAFGVAAFTWYAWTLIIEENLSLGSFVAFSAYLGFIMGPIGTLTGLFTDFQRSAVTFGRAFEYLDLPTEQPVVYENSAVISSTVCGVVQLDRVGLSYQPGQKILENVTLTLLPGTVTAVVGESGAGKSSLLRLLGSMDEPDSGALMFDGREASKFNLSDLRRQVVLVGQDASLFRGTLWQNLTFGVGNVDEVRVRSAIRLSLLEDWVATLPGGYQSMIAEWGATLSGGQRQRVAIARAIIREPKILLLDEATSQIDAVTEELLLRGLFGRMKERTVVFVTHRVASAALAHQICVMAGGQIVAVGRHDELVQECDVYVDLLSAMQAAGGGNPRTRVSGLS